MKLKKICFDLDNVICSTKGNNYKKSKPIKKNIATINGLYNRGFYIIIFTARYMGRSKENKIKAKALAKKITVSQLQRWKVKYNKLIFGKPSYDLFVDDKAIFFKKEWAKEIEKIMKTKF